MTEYNKLCNSKFKLNKAQTYLSEYMKNHDNLLIYHKIGSGKTCTSIQIAENLKKSYKILIVTQASLIPSYLQELYGPCANYKYMSKENYENLNNIDNEIINKSNDKINKYYNIISYDKYCSSKINLNKSLLIIDEVQNIISSTGVRYKKIFNDIYKTKEKLKIILMSATPIFDRFEELLLTFNLLRPEKIFKLDSSINDLKEFIHNNVSYYRGSNPIVFPKVNNIIEYCKMTKYQYFQYNKVAINNDNIINNEDILKISQLPNNFLLGERMVSNICFPTGSVNNSTLTKKAILKHLKIYSIKFYKLLKNIKKENGKLIIYSNFTNQFGIKSLTKILETNGYKNFSKHGVGLKRFGIFSGDENNKYRTMLKNTYNLKENVDGELIKIIILSPAGKEGLNFNSVKSIHIIEPYWNNSRIEQIKGRGIRTCSHKLLPSRQRYVNVYLYVSILPYKNYGISTDEYILKICNKKEEINKKFNKFLKEYALDCNILKKYNDIKCKKI
jgi:superfamily II DNA or RNA helicase